MPATRLLFLSPVSLGFDRMDELLFIVWTSLPKTSVFQIFYLNFYLVTKKPPNIKEGAKNVSLRASNRDREPSPGQGMGRHGDLHNGGGESDDNVWSVRGGAA